MKKFSLKPQNFFSAGGAPEPKIKAWCNKCNRQVEAFHVYENPSDYTVRYEARCHGKVKRGVVDAEDGDPRLKDQVMFNKWGT